MPSYSIGTDQTLEDGQYLAEIQSIEPQPADPNSRFNKPQLIVTWDFQGLEDEKGEPIELTRRQYVNDPAALTPKSNLYQVFSAVLNGGNPLDDSVDWDTDMLIGKSANVFWGSYIGEDGTTKQKIRAVSPIKAKVGGIKRKVSEPFDPDAALDNL